MTKKKRDKLIIEELIEELGGCWHERGDQYQESCYRLCPKCERKILWIGNTFYDNDIPSISTPNGFFWWWPRAKEKEFWPYFLNAVARKRPILDIINPDSGADALAEFLEGRKK